MHVINYFNVCIYFPLNFSFQIKGRKIFFIVPPNSNIENNSKHFFIEKWQECEKHERSDEYSRIKHLNDKDSLYIVEVKAGQALFLPAGTLHGVYTLEASLAYAGSWLSIAAKLI